MKWRSEVAVVLMVAGALAPARVVAQQAPPTEPDSACACHETPGEPGGGGNNGRLALFGLAGLALLSGLPFGASAIQGLPFAAAPSPVPGVQVAVPDTPEAPTPGQPAAPTRDVAMAPDAARPAAPPLPVIEQRGVVPPKTATHLPLLAAVGALMVGSGGWLAHRQARLRKNKRRRFVPI